MQLIDKESILAMTHLWEGERFPDGRPRVSDDIIQTNEGYQHRTGVGCSQR